MQKLAEPFRSAYGSMPADAPIWFERLANWPTMAWDNRSGTVTLVGDAAHPMNFREAFYHTLPIHIVSASCLG